MVHFPPTHRTKRCFSNCSVDTNHLGVLINIRSFWFWKSGAGLRFCFSNRFPLLLLLLLSKDSKAT